MSINWKWENKIGTWTADVYGKEYTFNIYQCNGLAVIIHEFKDEYKNNVYELHTFFADEEHLKNMLGLNKKYDTENVLKGLKKLSIIKCKEAEKIIKNLLKAEWENDIIIEIISTPF